MRNVTILIAALAVSGCATFLGTGLRDVASVRASEAYDESLHNAELWVCKGASAGSVIRRYALSDDQWAAWLRLCGYAGRDIERPAEP